MMKNLLLFWILLASLGLSLHAAPSQQIPPLSPKASELFITQEFKLKSQAGQIYRIYLAISKAALKAHGIAPSTLSSTLAAAPSQEQAPSPYRELGAKNGIFYATDGNGFFPRLLNAAAWDSTLAPEKLPIIIGLGHDSPLAYDRALRERDYLPPLDKRLDADLLGKFASGEGSVDFWHFIIHELRGRLHASLGRPSRELLAGHSFGGLFVLAGLLGLLGEEGGFSHYLIASPSLWWGQGRAIARGLGSLKPRSIRAQILLTRGELEDPAKKTPTKPRAARPSLSLEEVVAKLKGAAAYPGLVDFVEFKNQGHGDSALSALLLGLEKFVEE